MQRWKLTIEYDGTGFSGWQRQREDVSVQQVLEEAIFKFSGEVAVLHAAGRTDAGVHASAQVAHVDLLKETSAKTIRNAINVHARPHAVSVIKAEPVLQDFHARFNATRRYYRYVICNRYPPPVLNRHYAWHVRHILDVKKMQRAANVLLGKHDFTSFRAVACQAKSPVRTLESIVLKRQGDLLTIDLHAPSFLHHQVRNIVGTLKKIGEGAWPEEKMAQILAARDRTQAGPTAPPHGLFLTGVDYTDNGNK